MSTDNNIEKYGYTPVPRDPDVLLKDHSTASGPNPKQADYDLSELPFPDSELVRRSKAFVEKELNTQTFNHSHRVYLYGALLIYICDSLKCLTTCGRYRTCTHPLPRVEVRSGSVLPFLPLP